MTAVRNTRINYIKPLISPDLLLEQLPTTDALYEHITDARQAVAKIIQGDDERLLVIVGPCSIHDSEATMEYAKRLHVLQEKYAEQLCVVMRVYFEKPRTTVGWKGLINDPDLNDSYAINKGLHMARQLLLAINQLGLPVATEFLDAITPQYIADLVCWGAIGARTTESQVHRNLASGLSMPVGFKNATNGDIQVAIDAVGAALNPHHFLSVTEQGIAAIVATNGNPDCHVILRGGQNSTNYDEVSIAKTKQKLAKQRIDTRIIVDCSHGNSGKDHRKQVNVVQSICHQVKQGETAIAGVMIESNLVEGNQKLGGELTYGQSITDACVGWPETEVLLASLAQAVAEKM